MRKDGAVYENLLDLVVKHKEGWLKSVNVDPPIRRGGGGGVKER